MTQITFPKLKIAIYDEYALYYYGLKHMMETALNAEVTNLVHLLKQNKTNILSFTTDLVCLHSPPGNSIETLIRKINMLRPQFPEAKFIIFVHEEQASLTELKAEKFFDDYVLFSYSSDLIIDRIKIQLGIINAESYSNVR